MPGPSSYDPLRDGYATLITLELIPAVKLYERETTPPSVDGGGAIESGSMRSTRWRLKDPKTLIGLGDLTATVMYATSAYNLVAGTVNFPQLITLRWPDGALLQFYGFVDKFVPSGHSEGNLPTAQITIIPTMRHRVTGLETDVIFVPGVAG